MDKKICKRIDDAVSTIRIALYEDTLELTDEIQREMVERLIQTIHDRWEYMNKQKNKK